MCACVAVVVAGADTDIVFFGGKKNPETEKGKKKAGL